MLSILRKKNLTINKSNTKSLRLHLFKNKYNRWILNDKHISRAILEIIERLNKKQEMKIIQNGEIIIQQISGEYSCLVQTPSNANVLLLFPEILKELRLVNNERGLAILAHELGHLYYQHHKKEISTLEAQIEADHFAYQLELANPLVEILLNYNDIDSQTRVSVLTSKILSNLR